MRLEAVEVRAFRNLADGVHAVPPEGALLLGRNGQGKTNLLEAIAYPALFRSLRGAADPEVARHGASAFRVTVERAAERGAAAVEVTWQAQPRRKGVRVNGAPVDRLAEAVGTWLVVAFIPEDVTLAGGPAAARRRYLDRMLSLASPGYLAALLDFRAALAQRNAALRQGRGSVVEACTEPLARAGSRVVAARHAWADTAGAGFGQELAALGEPAEAALAYRGHRELADADAWPAHLERTRARDEQRGATSVGPHRDDLRLGLGGHTLRTFGSTGQCRTAAVALRLLELETLRAAAGEEPVLLLDDVYAELDGERQERLAARLASPARQVFLTAPRREEAPANVHLPSWELRDGRVVAEAVPA